MQDEEETDEASARWAGAVDGARLNEGQGQAAGPQHPMARPKPPKPPPRWAHVAISTAVCCMPALLLGMSAGVTLV